MQKTFNTFEIKFSKCYIVTDDCQTKKAQKGIKRTYQVADRDDFLGALYVDDKAQKIQYNLLNYDKKYSTICLKTIEKPALNPIYTKMKLKNRVLCEPYD